MRCPAHRRFGANRGVFWLAGLVVAGNLAFYALPVWASAGEDEAERPYEIVTAEQALDQKDYAKAIGLLEPYVQQNPTDADALTDLGVAYLDSGNTSKAIATLEKSLAQESSKLDTNAALGKAYLLAGNLPAAEKRLQRIDGLCFFGCYEERELKAEIAGYKAKH